MTEAIEVGAVGDEFRLHRARLTRELAQTYLLAQERSFAATEARATNLLGWDAAGMTALSVQMIVANFDWAIFVAAVLLALSASLACSVLWPGIWHSAGQRPLDMDGWREETELDLLEAVVRSCQASIECNASVAAKAAWMMRLAWASAFAAAPIAMALHFI